MDDSPASLQAARLLAGYKGDRRRLAVVALNVQSRPLTLWPGPAIDPGKVDEALLAEGKLRVEPACRLLTEAGLEPERAVRLGIPAESIAEEAMRRGATAILMGTRGHGILGGFALGSVALRVAHRAQAPVVLVKPDTVHPAALGQRVRALVPLDGSAHATRAVHHLLGWKDWLGEIDVDLVHIRSAPTFLVDCSPRIAICSMNGVAKRPNRQRARREHCFIWPARDTGFMRQWANRPLKSCAWPECWAAS
jgi:nucleotide-binding universal stress UspA family protein